MEREYVESLRSALFQGIPPPKEVMKAIFVDREDELKRLARALESVVSSGRGRALLITGDAGYGKSALIEYFKGYALERHGVAFSYVEMRGLASVEPLELIPAVYRMIIEQMESSEGKRGREILTSISRVLYEKYSGMLDKISFRLRSCLSAEVRERFEELGDEAVARALALMAINHLNPVAYDYLRGVRGLEPDEARLFERALGCRIPWSFRREGLGRALATIARAVREAGMKALVIAIDELEVLESVGHDLLPRFLAEFTAFMEIAISSPIFIIVASTPGFWSEDEKSVKSLYPFLFQRLNPGRLDLGGLKVADVRALAWKLIKLYEGAYGGSVVLGIDGDSLGSEVFRRVQPLGHPRGIVQQLVSTLDEKIVAVGP
jgi:hypothetical protein